ncbi:collagen alpha-1(II) chain-like [Phaenicophaeus curvirostris]|uniref:collagen alpha-1(II) chain-like n=1 Tax=Phaenicophaeus curvirostris TaxID=33595 RepID=UPI0037F09E56
MRSDCRRAQPCCTPRMRIASIVGAAMLHGRERLERGRARVSQRRPERRGGALCGRRRRSGLAVRCLSARRRLRPTGCGLGLGEGQRPEGPRAPPTPVLPEPRVSPVPARALGSVRLRSAAPGQGPAQSAPIGCAARHSASGGQSAPGERPGGGPRRSAGGWFLSARGPGAARPRCPPGPAAAAAPLGSGSKGAGLGRDSLTEVLAMREPLRDPDPSSGTGGEVMWRCPPGQQLLERCGGFPSLSYTCGGRRGGRPWVKWKRLPFSPKSQSGECPYCRKPGKSLAEQPCFFKARYSSTFHPVVRSNERAEDGLQGRENQSEASGQLDSKWGETLMPGEQGSFHC